MSHLKVQPMLSHGKDHTQVHRGSVYLCSVHRTVLYVWQCCRTCVCSLSECLHHSILSDAISVFERQHICLSENTASHEG